ncbi:DnaD domain protein [Metamycoplasma alkalescens]|uniref:Replication initiation and membrane attachment protein n=1 Tax=Metamycoplasma alkalescens TaxID=45363 RepID=A0A318U478_9BACT|nr:DnaD domain protein [Metamycoplasma alkalescens]PYF42202.1 replication initiation and membrane attachment protein [Metamycoplasma alkalescens]
MQNYKFLIDSKIDINSKDLINLRTFYTPIIGIQGISFYQYLFDLYHLDKKTSHDWDLVSDFLTLDFSELEIIKNKLEALGLIKTFQDSNGNLLFRLFKPLNANEIVNNILISNLLESKIGKEKFDFLIKKNAHYYFDEDKMTNISKNFFEIFGQKKVLKNQKKSFNFELLQEKDWLNNLSSEEYIYNFTKKALSPTQILMLKKIKTLKFSDPAINCIIKYSISINNSIVCNYIEKIANDFAKRNLFEADMIDNELNQVINYKNSNNSRLLMLKKESDFEFEKSKFDDGLSWDD